jgi:uncharacterized secreted repeat protein (TIGR03808 family)
MSMRRFDMAPAGACRMGIDRRGLFAALAGVGAFGAAGEAPAEPARVAGPRAEIDAGTLGVRPNAPDDQSPVMQRAIEQAAAARAILKLPPGFYRAGALQLPSHAAIVGVPGATRVLMGGGPSLLTASGGEHISLTGLVLDGAGIPLPERRGLLHVSQAGSVRIAACEIVKAGGNGIVLESVEGQIVGNTVSGATDNAVLSTDARGLRIAGNAVRGAGNGGILVWRSTAGDDGTLVVDNRVEDIANKSGGSGQYGNAINIFRAGNVIVRGNRIRNAAFSAVRGNSASNLQIVGNTCTGIGEVALYSEFSFEGAVVANNIVDGAALGVSIANFDHGARLTVVQGNLIRNLVPRRPPGTDPNDTAGIGIGIEADTVVSGNVIENAPYIGITAGWGPYLRDVAITGNVIRRAGFGITVSVAPGAGTAVIADNMIADVRNGAIVGMEWKKPVTGDLSKDGAQRYAQLSIGGNRVR